MVQWAEAAKGLPSPGSGRDQRDFSLGLSRNPETFWACVQCTTCTTVCPVVAISDNPRLDLDFTPQQVMNLLRLGLIELTLGSRMVWSCAACYQCQQHCPEGIRVTDIMCELRSVAVERLSGTAHAKAAT